jgi:hypothetical protein
VGSSTVDYALSQCKQNCASSTLAYYGLRKDGVNSYKCACLTRDMDKIVGAYDTNQYGSRDALTFRYCPSNYLSSSIQALTANTAVMNFLKVSKAELRTILTNSSQDLSENMVNICNATRAVNIVTIYMAAFLASYVNMDKMINNFTYDFTTKYNYPFHYDQKFSIFPPDNLAGFPGLEQAYWTIAMQYTRTNEWYLRGNKDIYWCSDQES